ncbi:MAG TPA: site-specific integrase [Mycobacteriales bacterium]|nr:site-specific integrase [Mycobacteriales bacterium]
MDATFGQLPMRKIAPSTVQAWINQVSGGLKPRSVHKYHGILHKIFQRAMVDQILPTNPCDSVVLPKVVRRPKRIVTPEEFDLLITAVEDRYRMLVLLAIESGLRWGELIALRPCDLDFTTRTIVVRRVIAEISKKIAPDGHRYVVKDYPKDDEQRLVQIEADTCHLLREHMLAEGIRDENLLFTTTARTPISRNTFRTRVWLPAVKAAGLKEAFTFHGLRGSHASWLLAGGADLKVVMDRLGHRQITTTQQYLGALPEAGERALAAFRKIRHRTD